MSSKTKIIIEPADVRKRRQAVDRFRSLLDSKTVENDWQSFFDENPFIFSETLSAKFDGLFRQVSLMSGRPDYVFCQKAEIPQLGNYGVIELKRPTDSIIGTYSSKFIVESKSLRVALKEASSHLDALALGNFLNPKDFFVAGNRRYAFIIIGSSVEIANKCQSDFLQRQFRTLLPPGFHLFTYDELLQLLSATVPPIVQVLFVSPAERENTEVTGKFRVSCRCGIDAEPAYALVMAANRFISEITVSKDSETVNGKSIMGLMMLAAGPGSELTVTARGRDAKTAIRAIDELFRNQFFEELHGSNIRCRVDNMLLELGVVTHSQLAAENDAKERRDAELRARRRDEMIRDAAYFHAQTDGFKKSPQEYWQQGEAEINARLLKEGVKS